MRNASTFVVVALLVLMSAAVQSQTPAAPAGETKAPELPGTVINDQSIGLQTSLYPVVYQDSSAALDIRWLAANDTGVVKFWHQKGDSILSALTELSGINWLDETITLYLVRYYPSLGSSDPLILPIQGIRQGIVTEAVTPGAVTQFNLVYQLSQRLLAEGVTTSSNAAPILAEHPLMQPGPYFRDNMALLLAYSVCQRLLGEDSTRIAYNTPLIQRRLAGHDLFDRLLKTNWTLMADKPQTLYLSEEKPDSKIVTTAYSMSANPVDKTTPKRASIEGLPPDGKLGFSIRLGASNQLVVDNIDTTRVAYRGGLRKGDIIRTVNGQRAKSHRELIEMIVDNLDVGATLQVTRNDKTESVYLRSRP